MSEALQSFILSAGSIMGLAILIPCLEMLVRRLRRGTPSLETPKIVQLTPVRPNRRS